MNSRDEFYKVDVSKIVYFEAEGNYTNFVLCNNQRGTVGGNLLQMQKILAESLAEEAASFARIGKRFIVNLAYVYHIEVLKQILTLSDGSRFAYRLPVSKVALKKLRDMMVAAVRGRETIENQ